ncbi:MAG: hypothetical protein ABFS32_16645, partial [Bacteroidota bacterium]
MYPSLDQIKKEYKVSEEAAKWLSNEVSPIILLEPKTKDLSIDIKSIAPGLNRVGCMIPYAPLFQ